MAPFDSIVCIAEIFLIFHDFYVLLMKMWPKLTLSNCTSQFKCSYELKVFKLEGVVMVTSGTFAG